jgi:hypothetical protein
VCGIPDLVKAYAPLQVPGFVKAAPPYPFRDRGAGTDAALVERRATELRDVIEVDQLVGIVADSIAGLEKTCAR